MGSEPDFVVEVGDTRRRDGFDQAQADLRGERLKEGPATTEADPSEFLEETP
ncbi:hypothetical protein GCM10023334_027860 [Nonomuraea thailandensis]